MAIQRPTTAIIGAGISGLTTGKMLTDYGIPYTCFETSDRVGGNWAFENPNGHSSAYRSLHIDNSKKICRFFDFPIPEEYPDFCHHSQIKAYLDSYADTFGLRERIEFENGVVHAERRAGGGWDITDQRGDTRAFDALVVANGHHWNPRYPDFPGTFDGTVIHSHYYIDPLNPLDLHGKRVLVVGFGNSAVDIASELSSKSTRNKVTLSTRSGGWIVPKYFLGRPVDEFGAAHSRLPKALKGAIVRNFPKVAAGDPVKYGLPKPDHNYGESHGTMSSELYLRLGSGDLIPKPNIDRLDGSTVHFVDGTSDDFDVIIYATGYNITFPFFDPEFLSAPENKLPLYKRMLRPDIDDLILVGFAQPIPTLFPFVECQSRLAAAYLAGTYRPPAPAEMERIIVEDHQLHCGHYIDRPRHTQQIDYYLYEHQLKTEELPTGWERARREGPVKLEGRASDALTVGA